MPLQLHGGGALPPGLNSVIQSGLKGTFSDVASKIANSITKSADIVDKRTVELPAVITEVHRLLIFANQHLPDMRVGLQIARNVVIAFAFIAVAAIISTTVTAAVKATDKTTNDDNHQKIADVTTAVLYSMSIILVIGIVIHSSLKWKNRKTVNLTRGQGFPTI
jgi:ABC-type proline/glycine betaine transport system permease subunit